MRRRNLIAAIFLLALGAAYAVLTGRLPTRGIENTTDPSFFPWVIAVLHLVLSGALLVQGLAPAAGGDRAPGVPRALRNKGIAAFAAFAVYLVLLPPLGFIAAGVPLFTVLMILYGERRPHQVILASLAIPLALFFLFRDVFQIRLPPGVLEGLIP